MAGSIAPEMIIRIDSTATAAAQNYTVVRAFSVIDLLAQVTVSAGGETIQASNAGVPLTTAATTFAGADTLQRTATIVAAQALFAPAGTLRVQASNASASGSVFFSISPTPGIAG